MGLLESIAREAGSAFTQAEFSEPASLTLQGVETRTVRGIFDRISEVQDIGELLQADGVAATFQVASADVADASHGDRLVVRGYDYGIHGIEPDGTGQTMLILSI